MNPSKTVSKTVLTMKEEENELLYWESQYKILFDKAEKKYIKIRKHDLFKTMLTFKGLSSTNRRGSNSTTKQ